MKYNVVIPAAGQGKRMNAGMNKQFILLQEKPVIIHTLTIFEKDPNCTAITLVVNESDLQEFELLLDKHGIQKVSQLIIGGKERQHSVYNGLMAIKDRAEMVLVHDGARPFVTKEKIDELVKKASECGAAILAVPVKDTIKKVKDGLVDETVERSSLWAVQTPQAFRVPLLLDAFEKAFRQEYVGTDEASLVERLNKPISVVTGNYENIKLTTKEDLIYAESILRNRNV